MSALALHGLDVEPRDIPRWAASFALILAAHLAAGAFVLTHRIAPAESGEALPAVMVDMAPPPAAPTAAPSETPPSETAPEAAIPDPVVDAPPDVPEPDVTPPTPAVVAEIPPLQPLPDLPPDPALRPPPVVQETAAVALPPPPKPVPAPKPVEKKVEAKPPKPVQAKRAERQEARRPPAQEAGAQTTASITSASSGSSAASRSSWQGALVAALRRSLQPQGGQTGSASVRFSLDRNGRILSTALVSSAGSPALDSEAIAVFRRASLPGAPPEVTGATFTFTIPIRFTTR